MTNGSPKLPMRIREQADRQMLRILNSRWLWAILIISVFAANAVWCYRNRLNGDVAWYLYAVTKLSNGAVLYRDIHDINLPIVYLMYFPIAWFNRLSGLPAPIGLYLAIWGLIGGILLLIRRLTQLSLFGRRFMVLAVAFAALSVNRFEIGQRDPLCAFLFALLVISAYLSIVEPERRGSLSWVLIVGASAGLALKPYFLVPWALVVGGIAWHVGLRRAVLLKETWMPLLVSVISWILTLTMFPDYLTMVAVASRYYSGWNASTWEHFPLVLPVSVSLVALLRKGTPTLRPLIHLSSLTTLGFATVCLLQKKAFPYHLAPSMFWGIVTAALLIVDYVESNRSRPDTWKRALSLISGSMFLAAYSIWGSATPAVLGTTQVDTFITTHGNGKRILILSTQPWCGFPLILESGATNARADGSLWTLGGIYKDQVARAAEMEERPVAQYHTRVEMNDDERQSFDQVIHILMVDHPDFIILDIGSWKGGLNRLRFDFIDYYSTDPRFKEQLGFYEPGPADSFRRVLVRREFRAGIH